MQWKSGGSNINMIVSTVLVLALVTINVCDGARRSRTSQRRKDTHRTQEMYTPTPSAESLQAIAEAMGAAGFEHYTEGRPLVKRLIPVEDQADLDLVEFQGVIGKAGVDFPAFPTIPSTGFNCKNVPTGYYADLETDCQVFHICDTSRKISFLCPNGTIFSQSHLICDWWFKVDCASAPALYESSAEYYSNEQKKTHKITQSLSKAADFIPDSNVRAESRRATVNVPSTTERLLRHRQKLQTDTPLNLNGRVTPRTLHALLEYSPTQRSQITTAFENRKRNLVQLISNNFGNTPKPTASSEASTHTPQVEVNGLKEMQVAAETASFAANNNNRQFLQDYNKNYRPYPVYAPNTPRPKAKANPNLTTLYDIRDKPTSPTPSEYTTTKRPTLVPYTKAYTIHNHRDPYTRPGVSLLKNFVQQERNRTQTATTEKVVAVTQRSDNPDRSRDKRVTIETKDTYESVTKIPHTTLAQKYISETGPADKYDGQASTQFVAEVTTEPSYKERRDRLLKKLNLDNLTPTEATELVSTTDKNYGDLPNRPGLVVPPSLTPKTLHSLAIYYATALDNLSTVPPEDGETTTPSFEDYIENMENLPGLFSQQTLNKYSNLFGQGTESPELLEEFKVDPNGTYNELNDLNDLSVQQSQNPIATSPQIRELAQVFTHALSAYLQDPVQFRKVLSDIRPTQPSFGDLLTTTEDPLSTEPTTTVNEEDHEILGFSDDHKEDAVLSALREPKALNLATDYPTAADDFTYTTPKPNTEYTSTTFRSTTPRIPFKCCGRISASYITPAPFVSSTTASPITNTVALNINTLSTNSETVSTESSYVQHRFGGFQNNIVNNDSPYGNGIDSSNARPLSEYIEATNLPTAWGIDSAVTASTNAPFSTEEFESKRISTTSVPTTNPVYFTETDSVDSENEEELQRAHSQSFIAPQGNSLRQGKQLNIEGTKTTVRKPSEELEAPTFSDPTTTVQTTTQPTTTIKITETEAPTSTTPVPSSIFTSPDSEKTTFIWTSNFDNWHSTVIDPITLNDGLSPTGPEEGSREANAYIPSIATTADYTATTEQAVSSTARYEVYAPTEHSEGFRSGRLLKDLTSTEPAQDISTITDTVVEKAKEIMGGMNATTTEKLMNVMKKTKSKTVRRLILLLVQTCDDDHNTTAEASKRALLEALMAVSQKDMDEIAKEEGVTDNTPSDIEVTKIEANRRTDRHEIKRQDRRGKSINFDPSAINSLSSVSTESVRTTQDEPVPTTQSPRSTSRRGLKKFHTKTDQNDVQQTKDIPIAEARVASQGELKPASDTRALELLRSLYTIAARWG